jgi:hypothetical protein
MNTPDRIQTRDGNNPFRSRGYVTLGDLSEKQYAALAKVAELSPGYCFCVTRYEGKGASATHVMVYKSDFEKDYVGLVGKDACQYYDHDKATEAVVKRVAHRVYRFSGFTMQ